MLLTRPVPTLSEPKKTPAVRARVLVFDAGGAVGESVTVPVPVWMAAAGALTARATAIGDRAELVGAETAMLATAGAPAQLIAPAAPASPVSKAPSASLS